MIDFIKHFNIRRRESCRYPQAGGDDSPALALSHVWRSFAGRRSRRREGPQTVLSDISLKVDRGKIQALVGLNGAGKTTLVKIASTLLIPTRGEVSVDGVDALADPSQARKRLGLVLGGDRGFYPRATVMANMRFFADLADVPYRLRDSEIGRVLEEVGLNGKERHAVYELSRGQTQRLHIARSLLGSPRLLLLDEPTDGLDPGVALHIRSLIRSVADSGVGILLTSHGMEEVEELADRIAVIDSGRILVNGSLEAVRRFADVGWVASFTLRPDQLADPGILIGWVGGRGVVLTRPSGPDWMVSILWKRASEEGSRPAGAEPTRLRREIARFFADQSLDCPADLLVRPASLEDAFLALAARPGAEANL